MEKIEKFLCDVFEHIENCIDEKEFDKMTPQELDWLMNTSELYLRVLDVVCKKKAHEEKSKGGSSSTYMPPSGSVNL